MSLIIAPHVFVLQLWSRPFIYIWQKDIDKGAPWWMSLSGTNQGPGSPATRAAHWNSCSWLSCTIFHIFSPFPMCTIYIRAREYRPYQSFLYIKESYMHIFCISNNEVYLVNYQIKFFCKWGSLQKSLRVRTPQTFREVSKPRDCILECSYPVEIWRVWQIKARYRNYEKRSRGT